LTREPYRRAQIATLALVSTASAEFRLELPLEPASWACREAVVSMGWEVEAIEPQRLVTRRGFWGFSRDSAKIEVLPSEAGAEATAIVLNGHIFGVGRGAKRHLDGEMSRLRNAAEVAARRAPGR
jgi:hypothetical protein